MMVRSLLVVLALTRVAAAEEAALSADEVKALIAPVEEQIDRCYLDTASEVRGAGQMDIVLEIHRRGSLTSIAVRTPGLAAKMAKKIDACVRDIVETVAFPARKRHTTATVPFFYQHTAAPGSGPQHSCWNPRGCPSRERVKPAPPVHARRAPR